MHKCRKENITYAVLIKNSEFARERNNIVSMTILKIMFWL